MQRREAPLVKGSHGDASARHPQLLRRAWHFFKDKVVQYVPSEYAACEFDCRVGQCNMGKWIECEHRIRMAAKEASLANLSRPPALD